MKKNFYLFALLILLCSAAQTLVAQIPNASFENFTNGQPNGWFSADTVYISQSTIAHAGTYAAKMPMVNAGGSGVYVASPLATGTPNDQLFYCNCRPEALRFWYILNSAGGDEFSASAVVVTTASGSAGAGGAFNTATSTSVYKEGGINFNYVGTGNMDSMAIIFNLSAIGHEGTYVIIDDLAFGATFTQPTGINDVSADIAIEKVQPNPATGSTNIIYNLPNAAKVTLEIFDITGRKMQTILNNEKQSSGRYKAIVDVSEMPAGNYFCRLNTDGAVAAQKLVVVK